MELGLSPWDTIYKEEVTEHQSVEAFPLSLPRAIFNKTEGFPISLDDAKCPRSAGVLMCS